MAEIEANDFSLNIPRYIDSTEPEDLQDIDAHLRGGIPNCDIDDLARYWEVFLGVRRAVRAGRPHWLQPGEGRRGDEDRHLAHEEFSLHKTVIALLPNGAASMRRV